MESSTVSTSVATYNDFASWLTLTYGIALCENLPEQLTTGDGSWGCPQ